jgi:hypothetical protein
MREFIRRLGKKVQGLLDRIFSKEDKKPQNLDTKSWTNITSTDMKLGAGEVFLDGVSLGKIESITSISKEDISEEAWESLKSIFGDGEINCGWVEIPSKPEIQKNFFNIPLTLLPKRYSVKTLLVSLAANQQSDYQAVDLSQYEEKGLAHFIIGRTCDMEELLEEYFAEQKYNSEEEKQEDKEWLEEMLSEAEDGLFSTCVGKATLLHYEELGIWSFEMEDD